MGEKKTKQIGKIIATEKKPTTIDEFYFWTKKDMVIKPFDVVKVEHIKNSTTYGVVEEISHITDASTSLAGYISSDFGDVACRPNTERIGMNYVKARVSGNTKNIYTPVLDGHNVSLANENEVKEALGLDKVENPLPCGYIEMYEDEDKISIPVHFNSRFLIGPEGAHLNISGISGLAAKTSYAMFLIKAIQYKYLTSQADSDESIAFVIFNVKGRDLLAIDEKNDDILDTDLKIYESLGLETKPFINVKYCYPYSKDISQTTYANKEDVKSQMERGKAFLYKYIFEDDKDSIDLLFANIDDPQETMDSIVNYIISGRDDFSTVATWGDLIKKIQEYTPAKGDKGKEITVQSWRKFSRIFNKALQKNRSLFANRCAGEKEVRLNSVISKIQKNEIITIDIAKLDENMQGFVFGDAMRAIYELKLGQTEREESEIPSKIIVFIDELNKYASKDTPKKSPILEQILDIAERGRSLGIILFSAEQFLSNIHDRVKGNCSTYAYGRTNIIETSKSDYTHIPDVYRSMLTRLKQGEYILQTPSFSVLNIKFPKPIYKQFK